MLFIDCTYKTNCYQILLYIISGVINLNIYFYLKFASFFSKTSANYIWILECLALLYQTLEISNLTLIVIDIEIVLINVIQQVFPMVNYALCLWHIDKNVMANYKSSFDIKKMAKVL